jgi:predicted NBD/HSP70 family sugar kinase
MAQQNTTDTNSTFAARGSAQSGIRAHNERLVLTLIRQMGPQPKADIARMTGLSAQTISVIIRALEADGLVEKGEKLRGKVGQPSVPIGLRPGGAFFLGLKVGRRSLDLVLIDFVGKVIGRMHLTHRYPAPDGVVRFAHDAIGQLLDQLTAEERARVAGLGIAIPFRLWDWAKPLGVEQAAMDAWRERDIAVEIAADWPFPVYLQNDASAACGAELAFGSADPPPDFLYFFIGFFVGGGLVLNHRLYTGKTGNAAALGSLPVDLHDDRSVQLVDVASLATLEAAVVAEGGSAAMIWESPRTWTVPEALLESWAREAAAGLARAIAAATSLIDFECVLIDGWLPDAVRDRLVRETATELAALGLAGIDLPVIRAGTIGSDARSLGAASLPLSERFLIDPDALFKG